MKRITITLEDSDFEALRRLAFDARMSIGKKAGEIVGASVRLRAAVVDVEALKHRGSDAVQKEGIDVEMPEERKGSTEALKTVNQGNKLAEELKRLKAANKAMGERYGK